MEHKHFLNFRFLCFPFFFAAFLKRVIPRLQDIAERISVSVTCDFDFRDVVIFVPMKTISDVTDKQNTSRGIVERDCDDWVLAVFLSALWTDGKHCVRQFHTRVKKWREGLTHLMFLFNVSNLHSWFMHRYVYKDLCETEFLCHMSMYTLKKNDYLLSFRCKSVTFMSIAIYTIQMVSEQLHSNE